MRHKFDFPDVTRTSYLRLHLALVTAATTTALYTRFYTEREGPVIKT